jgi:ABC-type Fe3+-hydroxamate transport system substrate-binding protein
MITHLSLKELTWLAPFALIGVVALMPLRPPSELPRAAQSRIVSDADGTKVAVPLPFGTVRGSDFLEVTHAPDVIFKIGSPRDRVGFAHTLMSRFYPEVLKNDALWDCPSDIESLLALSDGVTFFFGSRPPLWQRLGIPLLATALNSEDHVFVVTRIANAAIGREAQGEAFIADYQQALADLKQELRPEALTDLPRALSTTSSAKDWSSIWPAESPTHGDQIVGVRNAAAGFEDTGRQQEAERILAMNPDIIFIAGESVDDFVRDPRWQGLKAALSKRVYGGGTGFAPGSPSWGLDERPLSVRFEAEIVHPDRLQPKIRELTRDHFKKAYGYRLSDNEIDAMLGVEVQKNVPGYARFMKNEQASSNSTSRGGEAAPQ